MSKLTRRKSMEYIKKDYVRTRTMPANWYLSSYNYKFNITHMETLREKLKQKKLVGLQCSSCNRVFFPPRLVCGKCMVKPDRWVDVRETGQVASYTIAYIKDPETGDVQERPIVCAQLDGSDTSYPVQLNPNVAFKDTYVGMPIKVHWKDNPEGGLNDIEYYDLAKDDSKDLEIRKN